MEAEALIASINHDDPGDIVTKLYDAVKMIGGVLIELDTAWVLSNAARRTYWDSKLFGVKIIAKTDQEFVNKAFKKATGRNIIYVQSNFWGIHRIQIINDK